MPSLQYPTYNMCSTTESCFNVRACFNVFTMVLICIMSVLVTYVRLDRYYIYVGLCVFI